MKLPKDFLVIPEGNSEHSCIPFRKKLWTHSWINTQLLEQIMQCNIFKKPIWLKLFSRWRECLPYCLMLPFFFINNPKDFQGSFFAPWQSPTSNTYAIIRKRIALAIPHETFIDSQFRGWEIPPGDGPLESCMLHRNSHYAHDSAQSSVPVPVDDAR